MGREREKELSQHSLFLYIPCDLYGDKILTTQCLPVLKNDIHLLNHITVLF